jgi:DNA-binding HxlR family transcriptional regulator
LTPELDLTRDALASSPLSRGLQVLGDRWTVALIRDAFLGVRRFDDWQSRLGIPRQTLASRLKGLVDLGLMAMRPYQQRPVRHAYRLTDKGLTLYDHVLMMWVWERRWGTGQPALPQKLQHHGCGQAFMPELACTACREKTGLNDLRFSLRPNPALLAAPLELRRSARLPPRQRMGLGHGADRWALLIVAALYLGCHHFDQLSHALGIGSSVLARRLAVMVDSGLLVCQTDLSDGRRKVYRLTPASRDLFAYIMCFSNWASRHHFDQASSILPVHKGCGQAFVPQVVCSACHRPVFPREVAFSQ